MGGGSLWDVGCYPVSLARRIAGEEPDRVSAFARFDERGVDRTFIGQLHFPSGLLAQFDSGFAAPDRERVEIVGGDATLVLDAPFLPEPDGPPPTLTILWRGGRRRRWRSRRSTSTRPRSTTSAPAILDGDGAPRGSRLQSRYDRDARGPRPGGTRHRRLTAG